MYLVEQRSAIDKVGVATKGDDSGRARRGLWSGCKEKVPSAMVCELHHRQRRLAWVVVVVYLRACLEVSMKPGVDDVDIDKPHRLYVRLARRQPQPRGCW